MFASLSRFLCGGMLCLAVAAPNARAEYMQHMRADVPFEFLMKDRVFPAGTYTFSIGAGSPVVIVSSEDRSLNAMNLSQLASSRRINETSRLVFSRYGTEYVLTQLWIAGTQQGRDLQQDSRSRELAKRFAPPPVEIVRAVLVKNSGPRTK